MTGMEKKPWKVYFESSFWGRDRKDRTHAGKEIRLMHPFAWTEENWMLLAMYPCNKGVVVDFAIRQEASVLKAFMERWNMLDYEREPTEEELEQIRKEQPLGKHVEPAFSVNGEALLSRGHCSVAWYPACCFPEEEWTGGDKTARQIIEHYELDPNMGWAFYRASFAWKKGKKKEIREAVFGLEAGKETVYGPVLEDAAPGKRYSFPHPQTGEERVLTVVDIQKNELEGAHFQDRNMEIPSHHRILTYTLEPELPPLDFMIRDMVKADPPRQRRVTSQEASAIAIIGGADGPTAVFLAGRTRGTDKRVRTVCSSLHFEPGVPAKWQITFSLAEKPGVKVLVPLAE